MTQCNNVLFCNICPIVECIGFAMTRSNQGVFLGLGSNMPCGDLMPQQVLQQAVLMLPQFDLLIERASSIYETPPFPDANQPNFANAVVKVVTKHSPDDVLRACLGIEQTV